MRRSRRAHIVYTAATGPNTSPLRMKCRNPLPCEGPPCCLATSPCGSTRNLRRGSGGPGECLCEGGGSGGWTPTPEGLPADNSSGCSGDRSHGGASMSTRNDGIPSSTPTVVSNSCAPATFMPKRGVFQSSERGLSAQTMPHSSLHEQRWCAMVLHSMKPQAALAWTASTPQ